MILIASILGGPAITPVPPSVVTARHAGTRVDSLRASPQTSPDRCGC